jgi:chemotaxis protein histidine kinase CheA
MAEEAKVEEVVEEEVAEEETAAEPEEVEEVAEQETVVEVDPQKALAEVLDQKAKLAEVEADMLAKKEAIEASASELHHKLACAQVKVLFGLLDDLVGLFKEGAVSESLADISECLESLAHHDESVGKSLASGVYRDVVGDHEYFDWWLNLLQGYLIPGQPLGRVLQQIFSKPSGSPFAD